MPSTTTGTTIPVGSESGAMAWVQSMLHGGKTLPSSITTGANGTIVSRNGPYTLTRFPGDRNARIAWGNGDAQHQVSINWDINNNLTSIGTPTNDGESWLLKLVGVHPATPTEATPDQLSNTLAVGGAANTARNIIDSIPEFLAAISDPELWKRIGIGAGGVAIAVVAIYLWMKEGEQ